VALFTFAAQFYWDFRKLAEGRHRRIFDKKEYERLAGDPERIPPQLSGEDLAFIAEQIDEEIRSGRLDEVERMNRLRADTESRLELIRRVGHIHAAEDAWKLKRVPGEPDVIAALFDAKTPEQVRLICEDAFVTVQLGGRKGATVRMCNWPISGGSMLPSYLEKYAAEFLAAKRDPRFPRSTKRPSTRLKQLWFLSRALAGALHGVTTRTAINLVGSMRPEEMFEASGEAKPARNKRRPK